jgi:hypothetical protein
MIATHLDTMRTHIIGMICNETNEDVLHHVEVLLSGKTVPLNAVYSTEALTDAVLRSREDIRNGRVVSVGEMRRK